MIRQQDQLPRTDGWAGPRLNPAVTMPFDERTCGLHLVGIGKRGQRSRAVPDDFDASGAVEDYVSAILAKLEVEMCEAPVAPASQQE